MGLVHWDTGYWGQPNHVHFFFPLFISFALARMCINVLTSRLLFLFFWLRLIRLSFECSSVDCSKLIDKTERMGDVDNMWHPIELVITGLSGACLCPTFDKMKITFFSISVFFLIKKPGKLVNCQLLAYVCRVMKNGRYPVAQFMQRKGEKNDEWKCSLWSVSIIGYS